MTLTPPLPSGASAPPTSSSGDALARATFDALPRAHRQRLAHDPFLDSKHRGRVKDLKECERAATSAEDPKERACKEEVEASTRLKVELVRICAMMRARRAGGIGAVEPFGGGGGGGGGKGMDKARVLKVSWNRGGGTGGYTVERPKEIVAEFRELEDVLIRCARRHG